MVFEVILHHVPLLIAAIMVAEPIGVAVSRLSVADTDHFLPCSLRGRHTLSACMPGLRTDPIVQIYASTIPVPGPFVCTMEAKSQTVIFDGLHRMAAWRIQVETGSPYEIEAHVIQTKHHVFNRIP